MFFFSAKPKIIQVPEDAIANEGGSAKFTCVAIGEPQPTVFWEREGKSTPPMFPNQNYQGRFFVSRSGELQITDVQRDDEGVYTCMALSQSGNTKAKAQLTVIGKDDYPLNPLTLKANAIFSKLINKNSAPMYHIHVPFKSSSSGPSCSKSD